MTATQKNMLRFNRSATFFWIAMVPVANFTGLLHSLTFTNILSIYALAVAHLAAWRGDANPPQQTGGNNAGNQ